MPAEQHSYERELRIAIELAREAGAAILDYYDGPLKIEQKSDSGDSGDSGDSEPVTQADKAANEIIVRRLQREFPEDGILAEESIDTSRRLSKERVWMIDPLDGTTGFIDGNGDYKGANPEDPDEYRAAPGPSEAFVSLSETSSGVGQLVGCGTYDRAGRS